MAAGQGGGEEGEEEEEDEVAVASGWCLGRSGKRDRRGNIRLCISAAVSVDTSMCKVGVPWLRCVD